MYRKGIWLERPKAAGHNGKPFRPGALSRHMREETELTQRLLAEGYKPEDTPPGMCAYNPYYGGWTYDSTTLRAMVFETPCGLLAKGDHFTNGHMSYGGID